MTSGSPGQYRAFYEQPKPVEFDVELPDDIDGPDDLRDFLLDEAPFSRQAAVRVEPVTPGAPVLVPPSAQERPEGVPEGQDTGDTGSGAQSDVDALVGIITARDYFPLWSTPTDSHAAEMADRILGAGFRRVPEDAREGQRPKLLSGSPEGSPAWHAHAPAHFLDYAECDWDVCADYREEMAAQRVLRGGSVSGGGEQP